MATLRVDTTALGGASTANTATPPPTPVHPYSADCSPNNCPPIEASQDSGAASGSATAWQPTNASLRTFDRDRIGGPRSTTTPHPADGVHAVAAAAGGGTTSC